MIKSNFLISVSIKFISYPTIIGTYGSIASKLTYKKKVISWPHFNITSTRIRIWPLACHITTLSDRIKVKSSSSRPPVLTCFWIWQSVTGVRFININWKWAENTFKKNPMCSVFILRINYRLRNRGSEKWFICHVKGMITCTVNVKFSQTFRCAIYSGNIEFKFDIAPIEFWFNVKDVFVFVEQADVIRSQYKTGPGAVWFLIQLKRGVFTSIPRGVLVYSTRRFSIIGGGLAR